MLTMTYPLYDAECDYFAVYQTPRTYEIFGYLITKLGYVTAELIRQISGMELHLLEINFDEGKMDELGYTDYDENAPRKLEVFYPFSTYVEVL